MVAFSGRSAGALPTQSPRPAAARVHFLALSHDGQGTALRAQPLRGRDVDRLRTLGVLARAKGCVRALGGGGGGRALHSGDRRRDTPVGRDAWDLHLLSLSIEARSLRRHSRGCGGCAGPFALPRRQAAAGPGSGRCGGTLRAGRTGWAGGSGPLRARCGRVRRCRATGGRSPETRWGARRRLRGDSASAVGAGKKTAYRRSSVAGAPRPRGHR